MSDKNNQKRKITKTKVKPHQRSNPKSPGKHHVKGHYRETGKKTNVREHWREVGGSGKDKGVKCNMCGNYYYEDELQMMEDEEGYFKGCPNCGTDAYLMDVDDRKTGGSKNLPDRDVIQSIIDEMREEYAWDDEMVEEIKNRTGYMAFTEPRLDLRENYEEKDGVQVYDGDQGLIIVVKDRSGMLEYRKED